MSNQFCPHCGASVSEIETSCPYCQKNLSPLVSETYQQSFDIDPNAIQRKQNLFLWLFLAALVWGGCNIAIAYTALGIAKEEVPEATLRDIRFDRIEIQSSQYHTLQTVLRISKSLSGFLTIYMCIVWFQYVQTMGYSRWGAFGHLLLLLIPLVNLIVFLVMLRKGRVLITQYSG